MVRDKELKLEDDEASHTGGTGGRRYLRKGKWRGGERFVSRRRKCVRKRDDIDAKLRLICRAVAFPRMLPTLDLSWE